MSRTSLVKEYLGSAFSRPAIQFVAPSSLGLGDKVAICARLGSADMPVDAGWLVHQIRTRSDGSEMRSRFWMGGRHVSLRAGNRLGHLAGFLPELHAEFANN